MRCTYCAPKNPRSEQGKEFIGMGSHLMRDVAGGKGERASASGFRMGRAGNMMEWWSMSHSGERREVRRKGENHGGYNNMYVKHICTWW